MAAKKHSVRIVADYETAFTQGALIVAGQEIAPAKDVKFFRKAGEVHTFPNKQWALDFVKASGGNAMYIGKV